VQEALSFKEVAAANPDCEIVRVLHRQAGIEAFLMIPRDKIAKAAHPPFWRHGETMAINPAPPAGM
jgi:hypothetical protein